MRLRLRQSVAVALAALGSACMPEPLDVAGKRCDADRPCGEGYVCTVTGTCARDGDVAAPVLTKVQLEDGAVYATSTTLRIQVSASDDSPPLLVRAAEADRATGDCQSRYADADWQPLADGPAATVAPIDGLKKVCVWVKDSLGNVSVISPPQGTPGLDSDTIEYRTGTLPVITSFAVTNGAVGPFFGTREYARGDAVDIRWTVADPEGLANDPISLYSTTDGTTWVPVALRHGDLSGNPTSWSGAFDGFVAPSVGYFRLKLVAWDRDGNSSLAVLSDTQNTAGWSVWAGSPDSGSTGSARGAWLMQDGRSPYQFDVDPTTGDVYVIDSEAGVLRLDAETGQLSVALARGTSTNLPADGPLPADPIFAGHPIFRFDRDGLLYLNIADESFDTPNPVYQIDFARRWSRRYLGPDAVVSAGGEPVCPFDGAFSIDESHSLYFWASCWCGTGNWIAGSSTVKLLRVRQAADKTPGAIEHVAGNCVKADPGPPWPANALTSPLSSGTYPSASSLEAWNDGATIYYAIGTGVVNKILDGQIQPSSITIADSAGLWRNPANGKLYASNVGLYEVTPEVGGANGDSAELVASHRGNAIGCVEDGVDAAESCLSVFHPARALPDGTVLFLDGSNGNSQRPHRVRFKDSQGKVRTLLGTLPFAAEGMDRRHVRANFGGIHFKRDLPQPGFPAGLYFLDSAAPLFGFVDTSTEQASVLWGDQSQGREPHPAGTPISPALSMGSAYRHDVKPLAFDTAQGLPWLRYAGALVSLDANKRIVTRQDPDGLAWESATDGSNPALYTSFPIGLAHNLALKADRGAFFLGGYLDVGHADTLSIQFHDYAAGTVLRIMGNSTNRYSPDAASGVASLSLSGSCRFAENCFAAYREDEDRLYFSEDDGAGTWRLRYVTTPTSPGTSQLVTLFQSRTHRIDNFVFSLDGQQLYSLDGSTGQLFCHDLGSQKGWCNDTSLGPPAGMPGARAGPNQLTWRDATHLLVSNYRGEIYAYELQP